MLCYAMLCHVSLCYNIRQRFLPEICMHAQLTDLQPISFTQIHTNQNSHCQISQPATTPLHIGQLPIDHLIHIPLSLLRQATIATLSTTRRPTRQPRLGHPLQHLLRHCVEINNS